MTSSMLSGDRRWTSGRRGMTVLGKVAVPKPINLPSQRLENHGLDPNVELVPKGSLSWGSKSSSSSNVWGASTLSPKADGDSCSPSHLSARPSSGGSGTRPSTAGSERGQETANAWCSSSRPSSASGVFTTNQSPNTSLRPRSAETRPGSSHLSRFAEPVIDSTAAWTAGGTAEKPGALSSKNDVFSLASGDFPTLGFEREASGRTTGSQEHSCHSRPGSSSGKAAAGDDRSQTSVAGDTSIDPNMESVPPNSWRKENFPYGEDRIRPSVERWHTDHQGPHPYPHTAIPPQHYDAWHATVNNNPSGVWYRGPPGGPPYGSPLPRGFPLEPYPPYFRPQLSGNALPSASPGPPAGAGPRGHHPRNGDMYRPPMPEGYVHPVMPVRPGFYPGPVGYDSYYGPPVSYCGSGERDVQIMGVVAGTAPYNRHLSQSVTDAGGSHARLGGHGPADKLPPEQVQSLHQLEGLRPYKVLLKQHEGWDVKEQHEWDKTAPTSAVFDSQSGSCPWETDMKEEQRKGREMRMKMDAEEASCQRGDASSDSFLAGEFKLSDGMQNMKGHCDTLVGNAASLPTSPEVGLKGVTLIQKIEGLNAKARASEGQYEGTTTSSTDEQKHISNPSVTEATAAGLGVLGPDKLPACSEMIKPAPVQVCHYGDKSDDVMSARGAAAVTRKSTHHGRTDKRVSGRLSSQEVDGWQKRKPVLDAANVKLDVPAETSFTIAVKEHPSSPASELSGVYFQLKDEGQPLAPVMSSDDNQAQRSMLRELAKQRVKQRQKEEEEREKDQKAKALAKLEELNRRTLVENQSQKLGAADVTQGKIEELQTPTEEIKLSANMELSVRVGSNIVQLSSKVPTDSASSGIKEVPEMLERSTMIQNSAGDSEAVPINTGQQGHDGSFLKQKRIGYRKKHNAPSADASVEKTMSNIVMEIHEDRNVAAVDSVTEISKDIPSGSDIAISHNSMSDPPGHQRKRTNRSGKYKHQVDEALTVVLADGIPRETNAGKATAEGERRTPDAAAVSGLVQSLTESKGSESNAQMNNPLKNQHPRKTQRNQQAHRPEKFHSSDSVIWAPVKSNVKADAGEGASQKRIAEVVALTMKNDVQVQNNIRNRRAEMERYVPKPVAKEMVQQGTCQSTLPANDQTEAIEAVCREDAQVTEGSQLVGSNMVKAGVSQESRSSDGRPNRQGKGHRSWRQRPSADSTAQNLKDVNASETSQNTHKSRELHQDHEPDIYHGKPKHDQNMALDGWGFPENPDSTVAQSASVAQDQQSIVRGKRHVFKGNKVPAIDDHGNSKINSEGVKNMEESVSEMSQETLLSALKENRSFGDRSTSHWQPKLSNQWDGIEMESGQFNKKVSSHGKRSLASHVEKEAGEPVGQHLKGHFAGEKNSAPDATTQANQEPRKEGKSTSQKGCPHSPNRELIVEHPSTNMDNRHEQRSSSGFRKHGNQSSRLVRGHESHADWGSSGPDMRQTSNWEKQRSNLHYEYQPVGPQNSSRQHIQEGQNSGTRFRERGPNQSRHGRGNFYGRQGGVVSTEVVKTVREDPKMVTPL